MKSAGIIKILVLLIILFLFLSCKSQVRLTSPVKNIPAPVKIKIAQTSNPTPSPTPTSTPTPPPSPTPAPLPVPEDIAATIEINPNEMSFSSINIEKGLKAIIKTKEGKVLKDKSGKWSSSDKRIVTVDEKGLMKILDYGEVIITAEYEKLKATAKVKIRSSGGGGGGCGNCSPNPPPVPVLNPAITSLDPVADCVGSTVTINGSNFGAVIANNTVKFFDNKTANITFASANQLKVIVPAGAATGNVTVTVNARTSNGVNFTVNPPPPPPTITSLDPASDGIGNTITINGTNFSLTPANNIVKFFDNKTVPVSDIEVVDATKLKVKVPTDATTGNVTVTVNSVVSNGSSFAVTWPGPSPTPIIDEPDDQYLGDYNSVVTDGENGAIFAWTDERNVCPCPPGTPSTGNVDIFSQRISNLGALIWNPASGITICNEDYNQHGPFVISDNNKGAFIVWDDHRGGTHDHVTACDVYAQRVNTNGQALWAANGIVVCDAAFRQEEAHAILTTDGFIVSWVDMRSNTANPHDIYAQKLDFNGNPMWDINGKVVCNRPNRETWSVIANDNANGAIIAWEDLRNGNADVYAQRIDNNGNTLWGANDKPVCNVLKDQAGPMRIIKDGQGGAIVTWVDWRNDYLIGGIDKNNADVFLQRINGDGSPAWAVNGIPICTHLQTVGSPYLSGDDNGNSVLTWMDARGGNKDLYAQKVDINGNVLWEVDGKPICVGTFNDGDSVPRAAILPGNKVIVAWQDKRSGNFDIYAQIIKPDGSLECPVNGASLSTAPGDQIEPQIVTSATGAIVLWTDYQNGVNNRAIGVQWISN